MSQLTPEILKRFGLADRRSPDLYLSDRDVLGAPHASAMRLAFEDLGLAGVFCVAGTPTVAFLGTRERSGPRGERNDGPGRHDWLSGSNSSVSGSTT